jgi:hypothetical protein
MISGFVIIRVDDHGFNPDLHDVIGPFPDRAAVRAFAGQLGWDEEEYLVEELCTPEDYP